MRNIGLLSKFTGLREWNRAWTWKVFSFLILSFVFFVSNTIIFSTLTFRTALKREWLLCITGDLCQDTNPTPMNTKCSDPDVGQNHCGFHQFNHTPYSNFMSYAGIGWEIWTLICVRKNVIIYTKHRALYSFSELNWFYGWNQKY